MVMSTPRRVSKSEPAAALPCRAGEVESLNIVPRPEAHKRCEFDMKKHHVGTALAGAALASGLVFYLLREGILTNPFGQLLKGIEILFARLRFPCRFSSV